MNNILKITLFLLFSLFKLPLYAQTSIKNDLSYETLEKKIDSLQNDPGKAQILIGDYIKKSKRERNNESLFYAYRYASKYYSNPSNFKYADSALSVAKKSNNIKLLTGAYLNRGTIYMDEGFHQKALDDILISNSYSVKLKDDYLTHKTIYFIAQNKIYLGNYEDANNELKTCIDYFQNNLKYNSVLGQNSQMYYLYSMMSYIDTNTKLGKQYRNVPLINDALYYISKNNLNNYIPYFISLRGTDAYYNKDYVTAISKLKKALAMYNDQWSHNTEVFYLGLSNWKLGKRKVAIKYLEEIDKEYEKAKKLDPQFRSAYEILIKYHDSLGNRDQQLAYINKLMILDKSYEKNYKYLFSKINKEYDTKKLVAEKNKIEKSLQTRTYGGIFLLLLVAVLIFYGYRFYSLQKVYKHRFESMVAQNSNLEEYTKTSDLHSSPSSENENDVDTEYYNRITGLKPFFVKKMLDKLTEFELNHGYTDSQISIKLLSENFGTNYVYLSKIINEYRGKNFNIYINDLRLEYAIHLLKDRKYLDYDIKELSAISGFATPNNFSSNFIRKYKIKPSYFIKSLKNKQ